MESEENAQKGTQLHNRQEKNDSKWSKHLRSGSCTKGKRKKHVLCVQRQPRGRNYNHGPPQKRSILLSVRQITYGHNH